MSSGPLERRPLGRTSLLTTVMGYGAGGFSQAGIGVGADHATQIVAAALGAGVNIIDTAEVYGTESAVAGGVARSGVARAEVIIATKVLYRTDKERRSPADLATAVYERLDALDTDYLDVIQLHGLLPSDYTWARDELLPVLTTLRERGVVRLIGVTESFQADPRHEMLGRAVADRCWDTVMVGYNVVNQSARERVIVPAARAGVGVLVMFAVREALVDIDRFAQYVSDCAAAGELPTSFDAEAAVRALRHLLERESLSLVDVAYRFAATPHGVSTVLVGTGNRGHLAANRASFDRPRLDGELLADLERLFAGVETLTGESSRRPPS